MDVFMVLGYTCRFVACNQGMDKQMETPLLWGYRQEAPANVLLSFCDFA